MEADNFTGIVDTATTTFRDYLRVLFRHKAVVITAVNTVLITVFIGLTLKTPVYEAQVKMLISAEKQVQAPNYRELLGGRNVEEALTQSEIVTSAPVLERVVESLGLYTKPADYEKKYASPLKGLLIDFKAKTGKARLERYTPQEQRLLQFRDAVDDLKSRIKVEPVRDTNLFTISVREFDPVGAAVTANVVSRSYVIFDLEQQLADLILKYGEKHPTVQQLKDNINKMIGNLGGNPLSNVEAIGPATVKIIEQANVPLKPEGPRKLLILLMGFFMSIFLGVMLAFMFEYMDPTFKSPQDIESALNLSFLGSIPRRGPKEKTLIQPSQKTTNYGHFYQILSDQLYLLMKDKKLKSVVFAYSGPQEGTSTIIANLGLFLSQKAGHNVLLIDANLRNPALHKLLKIEPSVGLAEVLEGKVLLKEAIHPMGHNLHIMAAGTTELNPVILLDSEKAKETLDEAQKKYEIILVDSPNLKGFKDSVVLSGYTDAAILVVSEGVTRRQVLKTCLQCLQERRVNIMGAILNNRTFPIPKFVYERV